MVASQWNSNVVGDPMFKVTTKLKELKAKIKVWARDNRIDIHQVVLDTKIKLRDVQAKVTIDMYNSSLIKEEKNLLDEYKWAIYVETPDMKQEAEDDWPS